MEIGSEFWDVNPKGKNNALFRESTQWFLSGRSALQSIVRCLRDCHSVAMPSWCCDSMIKPFEDAGMEVQYYPVYWRDELTKETRSNTDVLFLMDYFGYTEPQLDLSGFKGIIIRDVTHSLFSVSFSDADYYFGSLRKWCGVWTGGFAWTKDGQQLSMEYPDDFGYVSLRERAMKLKNSYLHGYIDKEGQRVTDKGYLKLFEEAEEILEHAGIAPADTRDVLIAQQLDVEKIVSIRRKNAQVLRETFPDWLIFPDMKDTDCPMFVPIFVPDGKRDELRRFLIQHEIFCPVHWPVSKYHILDEREMFIYRNELSLVCDQRYTEEDMVRMVETIRLFWKGA